MDIKPLENESIFIPPRDEEVLTSLEDENALIHQFESDIFSPENFLNPPGENSSLSKE